MQIGSIEIKKTKLRSILWYSEAEVQDSFCLLDKFHEQVLQAGQIVLDTTPQRILLTGDSMVEGLMFAFKQYAEENGHELFPAIWYSSSTLVWGKSQQLKKLIEHFKPTIIFMALGSNELFIRNIKEDRAVFVDSILAQAGNIKFIWIGPPNWKADTGINDLLREKLGEKRFFLSKDLKLARASDGAHPTRQAAAQWADTLLSWTKSQSLYPFKLEKPKQKYRKTPQCVFIDGNYPN